ncbi:divalent cation tolerance protein [Lentzea albidocapillata subsp. violacea]|uniref:Divalent cation tolerance protein n=1 Tax=Lentzea albidocapillata subsp. violacea TaxID=128104 RepID=A0A1G9BTF4_9PSEU|nr:divalent-cation tolerance protein CutA [Lentzea albidocapillata]SDK42739.1 divalent cation tolerance protein [Lentzea albidocapillata subsp. violacea]
MSDASVVTTTVDSAGAAEALARGIVEARLGACVQIVPIRSVYRWDGEVRIDDEWQCVVKTSAIRVDELVAHIKANHNYEVPEVVVTPVVGGNDDYLTWVSEETS